jgi:hypothetical protein
LIDAPVTATVIDVDELAATAPNARDAVVVSVSTDRGNTP